MLSLSENPTDYLQSIQNVVALNLVPRVLSYPPYGANPGNEVELQSLVRGDCLNERF